MRGGVARVLGVAAVAVAACGGGPMSLAEAEAACRADPRLAPAQGGEIRIGIAEDGRVLRRMEIDIGAELRGGRDPGKVWQDCVHSRSGRLPGRPHPSL